MKKETVICHGVAASPGMSLGYVHILAHGKVNVPKRSIRESEVEREIARFDAVLVKVREQLAQLKKRVSDEQGDEHLYLIDAQQLMLDDRDLTDGTRDLIRDSKINAEWALARALDRFKELFDKIDDEYFRDRRSDLEFVEERLLRALIGSREQGYVSLQQKTVIVAHDLSPLDLTALDREHICGFAMDAGGRTSHTAIIARSLEIPTVVGFRDLSSQAENGDRIILDGASGIAIVRPDSKTWSEYEEKRKSYLAARKGLLKNRTLKAETKDQYEVQLLANLDLLEEIPHVINNGAQGIGVLRSEYLLLGGTFPPSEEEQFQRYRKVVQKIKPHETVIRLLDLTGDQLMPNPTGLHADQNPALGLRGIRLLLREKDLLRSQFRAILRASAFGRVAIMYPMVSTVSEIREANHVLRETMDELEGQKIRFDRDVRIGSIIETPSAALTADQLAQEVDFLSVGTNDLIQYTLGVDRTNELVAKLYDPFHRSVLQLLQYVVKAGHKAGIEVGVCGEMAAEPLYVPLLVGLEFNFLSMGPGSIPLIKQVIREMTMNEGKEWLAKFLDSNGSDDNRKHLSARFSELVQGFSA